MFGLYSYDIRCRGRKRHKRGLILALSALNAQFSIENKRSVRRLLHKYGRYDCNLKSIVQF